MRRVLSVVPLVAALLAPGIVRAQATREITGKVVQVGTNTPLVDATVGVIGSPAGVRTNEQGVYRIRVPEGDVTLLVRAIGFKRGQARVTAGQSTADFSLEKDVLQLEGVTVTGTSKRTGSVQLQADPWRAASVRSGRPKIRMKPMAAAWSKASSAS